VVVGNFFAIFGMLHQEKSVNPGGLHSDDECIWTGFRRFETDRPPIEKREREKNNNKEKLLTTFDAVHGKNLVHRDQLAPATQQILHMYMYVRT
jgi:hypothetical protein